jgi:ribonuclease HII
MTTVASAKATRKRVIPVMWRLRRKEQPYRERGIRLLAGVDEVGVGPLAGPLVAAAVIMPEDSAIRGVDDSKKVLSPDARERLAREILAEALAAGIGVASAREIERVNVYHAGLRAMARAVRRLDPPPELILVDARTIPGIDLPQEAHTKGDANFYQIACASLVAKAFRDALMRRMDKRHPGYGFARHMGYPTPEHHDALRRLGPCPIHRRNTAWVMECDQGDLWPVAPDGDEDDSARR